MSVSSQQMQICVPGCSSNLQVHSYRPMHLRTSTSPRSPPPRSLFDSRVIEQVSRFKTASEYGSSSASAITTLIGRLESNPLSSETRSPTVKYPLPIAAPFANRESLNLQYREFMPCIIATQAVRLPDGGQTDRRVEPEAYSRRARLVD